ncbi:MAG: hypothetical protein KFKLKKLM_01358 [Flavobacteriales bacterium]|nr:hypothetical protein [Flavobacteriales bacterium]MBV6484840.1 hypothetical protein [Flavobacteriales bacterium]
MRKLLIIIFYVAFFIGCGNRTLQNTPKLCEQCVIDENGSYTAKTLVEMTKANSIKSLQPLDSIHKLLVSKCTGISERNSFYFFSYDASRDLYSVIIEEDYSTSLFLLAFDSNTVKQCFLVAATGGDGGDAYEVSSQFKIDTLLKTEKITSVFINPETDDFTDSLRVDSLNTSYLFDKNKTLKTLHSDSSAYIRKWKQ